jgi:hypothetical protein
MQHRRMAISIDRRNYLCAGKRRTLELTAQAGKQIKFLLQLLRIAWLFEVSD